jgi:hypothetical protein
MNTLSETIDCNPLLRHLPVDIDQGGWWERLARDPFKGEDIRALNSVRRDLLIDRFSELYVPTQKLASTAYKIHRMLVNGLISRDPFSTEQRRGLYRLAHCAQRGLFDVPCISASPRGMLLQGVTKQGKTTLIQRVLSQYPQVIPLGTVDAAGWIHLDQLVYLLIPMPIDASKSGFLMQAFIELDKALGTNYAHEVRIRECSIDAQLTQLLAKLAMHRCGLLVVEEAQESNALAKRRFGRDFGTFFLRVLNSGIPTVLMGNPLAFVDLETNSQLMSRFTDPGRFELCPCASATAPEWTRDLVPGIWGANLLPEPDEPIDDLASKLYQWTGGFTHYLSVLRRETLRAAVERGASCVTLDDINAARCTPVMTEGQAIAKSYWAGSAKGVTDYSDIPGLPSVRLDNARGAGRRRAG